MGNQGWWFKICRETGRGIGKCGTACGGDGSWVETGTPSRTEILVYYTMAAVSSTEDPERTPVPTATALRCLLPNIPQRLGGSLTTVLHQHHTPLNLTAPRKSPEHPSSESIPVPRGWLSGLDHPVDETHQGLSQSPEHFIFNP